MRSTTRANWAFGTPLFAAAVAVGLAATRTRAGVALLSAVLLASAMLASPAATFCCAVALIVSAPTNSFTTGFVEPVFNNSYISAFVAILALACGAIASVRSVKVQRHWSVPVVVALYLLVLVDTALNTDLNAFRSSFPIGAFLIGPIVFVICSRSISTERWRWPCAIALAGLLLMAAVSFARYPGVRLGWFSGFPILFATMLVGVAPMGLLAGWRLSPAFAVPLAGGTVVALILSETRSAWIAAVVVVLVFVILSFRQRNSAALIAIVVLLVASIGLIARSGPLAERVETRLLVQSPLSGLSATHRESIYGYTVGILKQHPLVGGGYPGSLKADIAARSGGLNASDNMYLAAAGDLGLPGLFLLLALPAVALSCVARGILSTTVSSTLAAAALGLLSMTIVGLFFDTVYWPQGSALIWGLAGSCVHDLAIRDLDA